MEYDFGGYVTKNDLKCSDGRVIRRDAFKDCDGKKVPVVYQHVHDKLDNVVGHALLENRPDGVYGYFACNDTPGGKNAKEMVRHGDITSLSIYANDLVQQGENVVHGMIREVSLVLAGANPGATIDNISIAHADGSFLESEEEAIIFTGEEGLDIAHADGDTNTGTSSSGETIGDIINTMNDKQKDVLAYIITQLSGDGGEIEQSAFDDDEEDPDMKKNVFDQTEEKPEVTTLSHSQILSIGQAIAEDAPRLGSYHKALIQHAQEYGITNIDILFPEARNANGATPDWVKRRTEWVAGVLNGVHKLPYSRFKSRTADITADTARAKGYIKGTLKKEEFFAISQRETGPQTIYKKQKFDRDDVIDVTDFDVVSWVRGEMRLMLDEEIARAILVGDGREVDDEDKIHEDKIRPVWTDDDFYTIKIKLDSDATPDDIMEAIIRGFEDYEGAGNPTLYTVRKNMNDLLLQKDQIGRYLYRDYSEIANKLGVRGMVDVPVMKGLSRKGRNGVDGETTSDTYNLWGLILNISDYDTGTDRGGQISMFDDFDIDYNQYKYLLETRMSGALVRPKTAIAIEVKSA